MTGLIILLTTATIQLQRALRFLLLKHSIGRTGASRYTFPLFLLLCVCVCVCVCERERERVTQSCLTLCNPMDCSPPGSSVHGILQARILEWVALPFSRESS